MLQPLQHLNDPISSGTVIVHSQTPEPPESNNFYNFRDWKIDAQELKYPTYISKAVT